MESQRPAKTGGIRGFCSDLVHTLRNLRISEKISGIVALQAVVMVLLVVMSIQSVRLQAEYRRALSASATAAVNMGRVNALIFAIVMESRGIYMSTEPAAVRRYADEVLRRNQELADAVAEWEKTVDLADQNEFPVFKQRIAEFLDFRNELVRRATRIGPAAARAWGDVEANRALRSQLNADLGLLAKAYDERAVLVAELADETRLACWYLALLGLGGLLLTPLNVLVVRRSVIAPLSDIAKATDSIANGTIDIDIPHVEQWDEIEHLAPRGAKLPRRGRSQPRTRAARTRHRQAARQGAGTARQGARQISRNQVAASHGDQQHGARPGHG